MTSCENQQFYYQSVETSSDPLDNKNPKIDKSPHPYSHWRATCWNDKNTVDNRMITMKAKMTIKEQKNIRDYSWSWCVCKQASQRDHSRIPRSTLVAGDKVVLGDGNLAKIYFWTQFFRTDSPSRSNAANFFRTNQRELFKRIQIFFARIARAVRTDTNFLCTDSLSRSNG